MRTVRGKHRTVALLTAAVAVCGACGGKSSTVPLGLKNISLDLAFKDASKAKPPTLVQIVQTPQLAPQAAAVLPSVGDSTLPANLFGNVKVRDPFACDKAPAGARPEEPTPLAVDHPPAVGTYYQHNKGTFDLSSGPLRLAGPYPALSQMDITNVKLTPVAKGLLTTDAKTNINYDLIQHNAGSTVITTYQVTATELDLVKQVLTVNGTTTTFNPTPVVTIMKFQGFSSAAGSGWTSAGIDQQTGTVMTVQGSITGEEPVDLCGKVYDSWQVTSTERILNVQTQYTSTSDPNDPIVYNIANQLGSLIIRKHENTTTSLTANGVPVTLQVNNTWTLGSATPLPLQGAIG